MKIINSKVAEPQFVTYTVLVCLFSGIVTSFWTLYIDDVINNDAVVYIRTAEYLSRNDWWSAMSTHHWPFFSLLMLYMSDIFTITYQAAGQILNAVFFTVSSALFVFVVRAFGGVSQRLTVFAALIAILHPAFNEYRAFIIRDAGYLMFYLIALLCLAKSVTAGGLWYSIGLIFSLAVSSLFRIEGVVFLLLTPLLLKFSRRASVGSGWSWLLLLVVAAGLLAIVVGWWLVAPNAGGNPFELQSPFEIMNNAWSQIGFSVTHKIQVLKHEFLGQYATEYAYALFIFAVITILISAVLSQLTIPWAAILFVGLWSGVRFPQGAQNRLWLILLGMHLVILLVFAIVKLFLVSRYPLALTITSLIMIPFVLDWMVQAIRWQKLNIPARLFSLILLVWGMGECVSGLDNFTRAHAIKDAGQWLDGNALDPMSLVTNDSRIAYYAGRHNDTEQIVKNVSRVLHGVRKGHWPEAKYLAFRLSRSDNAAEARILNTFGKQPHRIFERKSGDRVLIYTH